MMFIICELMCVFYGINPPKKPVFLVKNAWWYGWSLDLTLYSEVWKQRLLQIHVLINNIKYYNIFKMVFRERTFCIEIKYICPIVSVCEQFFRYLK